MEHFKVQDIVLDTLSFADDQVIFSSSDGSTQIRTSDKKI